MRRPSKWSSTKLGCWLSSTTGWAMKFRGSSSGFAQIPRAWIGRLVAHATFCSRRIRSVLPPPAYRSAPERICDRICGADVSRDVAQARALDGLQRPARIGEPAVYGVPDRLRHPADRRVRRAQPGQRHARRDGRPGRQVAAAQPGRLRHVGTGPQQHPGADLGRGHPAPTTRSRRSSSAATSRQGATTSTSRTTACCGRSRICTACPHRREREGRAHHRHLAELNYLLGVGTAERAAPDKSSRTTSGRRRRPLAQPSARWGR